MEITTAVIPAAGLGTRFLPMTKSVPKELLPILDKPMLQYVVEEASEAGIERVIIVTAKGKESIASYFQPNAALERHLAALGAGQSGRKSASCVVLGPSVVCYPRGAAWLGSRRADRGGSG